MNNKKFSENHILQNVCSEKGEMFSLFFKEEPKKEEPEKSECKIEAPSSEEEMLTQVEADDRTLNESVEKTQQIIIGSAFRRRKLTSVQLAEKLLKSGEFRILGEDVYFLFGKIYKLATVETLAHYLANTLEDSEIWNLSVNNLRDAADMFLMRYRDKIPKAKLSMGKILFNNGLLDVETGNFVKQTDEDFLLFSVNACYCPDEKIETPVFDKFVETITEGDKRIKKLFCEFLGYLLLHENNGRSFFVLGPERSSGKTSLCLFLERLLGEKQVSHVDIQRLDRDNESVSIKGKILNIQSDSEMRIISPAAVGKIKKIAFNCKNCQDLHMKAEYFRYYPKFIVESATPLKLKESDAMFWSLFTIIPFVKPVAFEDEIDNLFEAIWEERDGIVKKAVKGARRLVANEFEFTTCLTSELLKTQWQYNEIATIGDFIEKCCVIDNKPETRTHTAELYDAYVEFCDDYCIEAITENAFSRTMKKVYELKAFRCKNGGQKPLHGFEGICLKDAN